MKSFWHSQKSRLARIFVILATILVLFSPIVQSSPVQPLRAPSARAASDVSAIAPVNASFNALPYGAGAPTNSGFSSAAQTVGTPPSNYNFASGLTGWTASGTVTVVSGGPDGQYAKIGDGTDYSSYLTSSAFTVNRNAQVISFKRSFIGQSNILNVRVLTGSGYSTSNIPTIYAPSGYEYNCDCTTNWERVDIDVSQWQGQSIKLSFNGNGYTGITDVGTSTVELPNWTVNSGTVKQGSGAPTGTYATLTGGNTTITSSSFTLDENTQSLSLRLKLLGYSRNGNILWVYIIPDGGSATKI